MADLWINAGKTTGGIDLDWEPGRDYAGMAEGVNRLIAAGVSITVPIQFAPAGVRLIRALTWPGARSIARTVRRNSGRPSRRVRMARKSRRARLLRYTREAPRG